MADRRQEKEWGVSAVLALIYTFGFLAMVGCLFFVPVPKDNQQLLNTVVGIMGTIQVALMSYFYGYTKGAATAAAASDARKSQTDQAMQDIAKASAPVAAAAAAAAQAGTPVTILAPTTPSPMPTSLTTDTINVQADNAVVSGGGKA